MKSKLQKWGNSQGVRPSLVLSNDSFNKFTKMALVYTITSNMKEFSLHVKISDKNNIKGVVMCEQIKAIDFVFRNATFKEKLCDET